MRRILEEQQDLGAIRADAVDNVVRVAWVLCRYTDWHIMCARPGWRLLAELTGLSETTIKRVIRRLRNWGLLGVVETGSTWRTRGCDLDDTEGNRAGVYVLCVLDRRGPVEISDPPSALLQERRNKPHARTRESRTSETANLWPIGQAPVTRRDQLRAADRLARQMPPLRTLSARYLRSVLRRVFRAGWSPAQIVYALDHTPDGAARWHTDPVRHPAAWVAYRLAGWRSSDGTWITPPAQLGAGRSTDLTAADVVALPRVGQPALIDVAAHAAAAREMLAAVRDRITARRLYAVRNVDMEKGAGRIRRPSIFGEGQPVGLSARLGASMRHQRGA